MLAYKITNWSHAPGPREAHIVVTPEMRDQSRRRTRARLQRIARLLDERDTPRIHRALSEVTHKLGYERTETLVEEARAIFNGAGMLVRNGSRPRTLGGIFFQLASRAAPAVK